MECLERIIEILRLEGVDVQYNGVDVDLREVITDSIQFISFIVEIESEFEIEIMDEYLQYDMLASLHSFAKFIENCFLDEKTHNSYKETVPCMK